MKKINHYIIGVCALLTLGACEDAFQQVVEIELEPHDPLLTIDAKLAENDSLVSIFVSHSMSILENQNNFDTIDQAEVTIKNSGVEIASLQFNPENGNYEMIRDFDFIPGSEYQLEVSEAKYGIAKSSCIMPIKTYIKEVEFFLGTEQNMYGFYSDHGLIRFDDDPNEHNYYGLHFIQIFESGGEEYRQIVHPNNESFIAVQANNMYLINDDLFNGTTNTIEVNIDRYENENIRAFEVVLYTLTKEEYDHAISVQKNSNSTFNPFVEPVIISSNIENGYGIFSIRTVDRKRIDL